MSESDQEITPYKLTLSLVLADRRSELTLTQNTIADHLGIKSPEYIGLVERGKRGMDMNKVPLLAEVLKVNSGDLVKVYLHETAPLAYASLFSAPPSYPRDIPRQSDTDELLGLFGRLDQQRQADLLHRLRVNRPQP